MKAKHSDIHIIFLFIWPELVTNLYLTEYRVPVFPQLILPHSNLKQKSKGLVKLCEENYLLKDSECMTSE